MKLLVVSDIHGSGKGAEKVFGLMHEHKPDLLVICGDITNFGPAAWADDFLRKIEGRCVAVHGNCDTKDVVNVMKTSHVEFIHNRTVDIDGYTFIGWGGEFTDGLKDIELSGTEKIVLVTHAPARGHVDKVPFVGSIGSRDVLEFVTRHEPIVAFSGHVHEARGVEKEGGTVFVNPGPAKMGHAAIVELDGEVKVELF